MWKRAIREGVQWGATIAQMTDHANGELTKMTIMCMETYVECSNVQR